MRWASAISEHESLDTAVREVAEQVGARLGDGAVDLAVVFVSAQHSGSYERVPVLLRQGVHARHVIGCSGGGTIGAGREVEHRPSISLTAAVLPGTEIRSFHVDSRSRSADPEEWDPEASDGVLLLADPFTFQAERFVRALDRLLPGCPKVGGLASGGSEPGRNVLYSDEHVCRSGMVGVRLSGGLRMDSIVAQGCRPIGLPMFVTRCDQNIVQGLDGRSPKEVLVELYQSLGAEDQQLFRHSLFLGVAMLDARQEYGHGDFLVRNIVGLDPDSGFLAVGAEIQTQMVVQFHLRDSSTSHDDLDVLLRRYRAASSCPPAGGLLFSCLGRGERLYGRANHDSELLTRHLGPVPLGGFFCNGEIGPVHGRTFLHGYTSSFALFRPEPEGTADPRR